MTDYAEILLADDTSVRLELAPVRGAARGGPGGEGGGPRPPRPEGTGGVGGVTPVGRGSRTAATLATDALRTVLRPLGPVLQEVHDAVRSAPNPPDEINVQFGVQVGQDLKLGIVGANGHASLTVSATWKLSEGPGQADSGSGQAGAAQSGSGQAAAAPAGPGQAGPGGGPGSGPAA
ncbi:CU044_2847 family protein [Streptomyces cuspidosporus]|uniref:Trypsin-co-occurring domain-containing protein n=1 Tax=Streptomyces cuspidosporus TaxID=66882 RepID=A0ABP5U061_9ACTN